MMRFDGWRESCHMFRHDLEQLAAQHGGTLTVEPGGLVVAAGEDAVWPLVAGFAPLWLEWLAGSVASFTVRCGPVEWVTSGEGMQRIAAGAGWGTWQLSTVVRAVS